MKKSIYILALGAFGIITTEFGVIGILPMLAKAFSVSIETAGWLLSAFALTIALTGPFVTLLTAKINRKVMMCLVLLVFVLSNVLSALSTSFTMLLLARILPAFLHPVFWSVAMVAAAKQVPPQDAPKAVSIVFAGLSVATVLGVPLTTYAATLFNWQASFLLAGLINLVSFLGLAFFFPSMPVSEKLSYKSQLVVLKNPQLWINLIATLIMIAGMFATYGYLAAYLSKVTHMSGSQISIMLLIFGFAGLGGNWLAGILLTKSIAKTTRLFFIALIGLHLLIFSLGGHFLPMVLLLALWGFVHTSGFLIGTTRIMAEAGPAPELGNSLMVSFGNAGVTVGSLLGGLVISVSGVQNIIWMSIGLLAVAFALTFVLIKKKENTTVNPEEAAEPAAEVSRDITKVRSLQRVQ
jgi:predicted MFS family arabinose efflux permease